MNKKEEFENKYRLLIQNGVEKLYIDIKKRSLPSLETIIVPKENFEAKLKEILFKYDDNMELRNLNPDKYNFDYSINKIVGLYSELYSNILR